LEGLREIGKKFNLLKGRDFRLRAAHTAARYTGRGFLYHRLDIDEPGIGKRIAELSDRYGVDNLNALFLTPLPGTRLWDQMKSEGRIVLDTFRRTGNITR
jgi:radical SAM superfamily enzyme YgiQ (UPF0313 family)